MKRFIVLLVMLISTISYGAMFSREFVGDKKFKMYNNSSGALTWSDLGEDLTWTFSSNAIALTSSTGVVTLNLSAVAVNTDNLTVDTGKHITVGTTQWDNGSNAIDGEVIANDTIDDDSIDFADVTIADFTDDVGFVHTNRASQQFTQSIAYAKLGASGAGWVIGAADSVSLATLPASQTNENMVIPVTIPLKVGAIITGFSVVGQIESAGGAVTLDADLRKHTTAAADVADASVGTITQVSVTADTAVAAAKTGLNETVAADETFYVLVQGTTAESTDIAIQGITVTITEP